MCIVQCSPSCKNGGTCIESSADSSYSLVCDCPTGYVGADCGQKSSTNTTPIIIGTVVGGGGALLILGAAVVYLFFFRKPTVS